jgi:hypothetical protein
MEQFFTKMLGIRNDFERIFFKNEYIALAGPRRRTIIALWSILFFTFLALGFAVGSLGNLKRKMDNPYTNWVDVEVRSGMDSGKLNKIKERYNTKSITDTLQLKSMMGWTKFYQDFYAHGHDPLRQGFDTLRYQLGGRTIESEDFLLTKILEEKNVLWHSDDFDPKQPDDFDDCEIIITEAMMTRLGFSNTQKIGYLESRDEAPFFIRVAAVVRELPNFCYYICRPKLYNILKGKRENNKNCADLMLSNVRSQGIFYLLTDQENNRARVDSLAARFFAGKNPSLSADTDYKADDRNWQSNRFAFLPTLAPPPDSVRQFVEMARKIGIHVSEFSSIDCGANFCNNADPGDFHYLAFNFDRLDRIRAFSQDMQEKFQVKVDMAQVEAKENFALVSRLTFAISLILLGFGILSIVLFVNNLLRTHLFEVRSNLGTFQAFGLDNRFLIRIYLKIIFAFLALSVGVSLLLAIIVDRIEQFLMGDESRFNIFSLWVVASIVGLMSIGLWLSYRTIHRILSDSPGNLIYER